MERFLKHRKEKAEVMEEGEEATRAVVQVASILRASNPVAMPVKLGTGLMKCFSSLSSGPTAQILDTPGNFLPTIDHSLVPGWSKLDPSSSFLPAGSKLGPAIKVGGRFLKFP